MGIVPVAVSAKGFLPSRFLTLACDIGNPSEREKRMSEKTYVFVTILLSSILSAGGLNHFLSTPL